MFINQAVLSIFRALRDYGQRPDCRHQQDMEKLAKTEWRRDWEYAYYKLLVGEKP